MVDVKELRVGNWVLSEGGNYFQVTGLLEHAIDVGHRKLLSYAEFNPIPLTPEILEKCGFEKDGFKQYGIYLDGLTASKRYLYFGGDYLMLEEGDRKITADLITIWNKDIMKTFYLHQLQNLYFALTGTELNYEL